MTVNHRHFLVLIAVAVLFAVYSLRSEIVPESNVAAFFGNGSEETIRRDVAGESKAGGGVTSQAPKSPAPSTVARAGVDDVLLYLRKGPSGLPREKKQEAVKLAASNVSASVGRVRELIGATASGEAEERRLYFGAMAELVDEVRRSNPQALGELFSELQPIVHEELKRDSLLVTDKFDGMSDAEKHELEHHRFYKLKNGKVFAMSLPTQLSALYVLGMLQTSESSAELARISQDASLHSDVREHAGRILNSKLYVTK